MWSSVFSECHACWFPAKINFGNFISLSLFWFLFTYMWFGPGCLSQYLACLFSLLFFKTAKNITEPLCRSFAFLQEWERCWGWVAVCCVVIIDLSLVGLMGLTLPCFWLSGLPWTLLVQEVWSLKLSSPFDNSTYLIWEKHSWLDSSNF